MQRGLGTRMGWKMDERKSARLCHKRRCERIRPATGDTPGGNWGGGGEAIGLEASTDGNRELPKSNHCTLKPVDNDLAASTDPPCQEAEAHLTPCALGAGKGAPQNRRLGAPTRTMYPSFDVMRVSASVSASRMRNGGFISVDLSMSPSSPKADAVLRRGLFKAARELG